MPVWVAAHNARIPIGTLHRWLHEGRLTRYGEGRKVQVDWAEVCDTAQALGRKLPWDR